MIFNMRHACDTTKIAPNRMSRHTISLRQKRSPRALSYHRLIIAAKFCRGIIIGCVPHGCVCAEIVSAIDANAPAINPICIARHMSQKGTHIGDRDTRINDVVLLVLNNLRICTI